MGTGGCYCVVKGARLIDNLLIQVGYTLNLTGPSTLLIND
jgi:hypothetical protein